MATRTPVKARTLRNPRRTIAAVVAVLAIHPAGSTFGQPVGAAPPSAATSKLEESYEHYRAGRYEEAVASSKAALEADPNSADAYNNLAVSYLGLRRFDDAIKAAEEAIRLRPDYQLAKNNLAWIRQEQTKAKDKGGVEEKPEGEEKPTIEDKVKILILDEVKGVGVAAAPASGGELATLVNDSVAHAQAGRFSECLDSGIKATKLDPRSAAARITLGFCAAKKGFWDFAIQSTRQALDLDPNLEIAKKNLVWMEEQKRAASGSSPR